MRLLQMLFILLFIEQVVVAGATAVDTAQVQGGVGLAVRTSNTRAARPPEFISDRLLKVHKIRLQDRRGTGTTAESFSREK